MEGFILSPSTKVLDSSQISQDSTEQMTSRAKVEVLKNTTPKLSIIDERNEYIRETEDGKRIEVKLRESRLRLYVEMRTMWKRELWSW